MAVEGLVGEAWIAVRPYTADFAPTLKRDLTAQTAVVDGQLAAGGGLIGPKTVAATEKNAASAGERAVAGFNKKFSRVGQAATQHLTGALVGGLAIAETGKAVVEAATNFETAEASIASQTGQTTKQVASLGSAFLQTARSGETMFKASDLANSYAAVSGQLKLVTGRVLNNSQALQFMKAAEDDAEASQGQLGSTTSALAATMQAFHIPLKDVSSEADTLYNISRALNVPITSVSTAVDRMHTRLGIAAPTLSDTGALMVSFGKAGVQGQRGLMIVNSALSTLLAINQKRGKGTRASAMQIQEARIAEQSATDAVIVAQHKYGRSSEQYALAVERQQIAQAKLAAVQKVTAGTMTFAGKAASDLGLHIYDAHGKFVGMGSIIAQLQPKLAKMSDQQRTLTLQTLFGKGAAQLMNSVIQQGIPGWRLSNEAVTRHGTAARGAALQQHTLRGETRTLTSQMDALAVEVGQKVIPIVTNVTRWFVRHQAAATALAGVIGTVMVLAIGRYVGKLVWATAQTAINIGKQIAQWTGLSTKAATAEAEVKTASTQISAAGTAAGTELETAGTTASSEIETGASTAGADLGAAGATAGTEIGAGAATAEAELTAGGATAEAELSAGGATAEAELSAGGATAGAELGAGGMAAGAEGAAGGLAGAAEGAGAAGAGLAAGGLAAGLGIGAAGIAAQIGTTELLKHTPAGKGVGKAAWFVGHDVLGIGGGPDTHTTKKTNDIIGALDAYAKSHHETRAQLTASPAQMTQFRQSMGWSVPKSAPAPTPPGWHAPMALPTVGSEVALKRLISEQSSGTRQVASHTNETNAHLKREIAVLERIDAKLARTPGRASPSSRFLAEEFRQ